MLFTVVICGNAIAAVLYYFDSIRIFILNVQKLSKIPGPPNSNFLIGNILQAQTSPENTTNRRREFAKKYFPFYTIRAAHIYIVNILRPDEFEAILLNPKHNKKSIIYSLLHDWLRTGLLTSAGEKWMTRRKILTTAFHFRILQQFVTVFNEQTEKLVEGIKAKCHKPIDLSPIMAELALKNIAETAMGTKLTFTTEKEIKYKQTVHDIGLLYFYRCFHIWFIFPVIRLFCWSYHKEKKMVKILHEFTKEIIAERQKIFEDVLLPTDKHDVYIGKKRLAMLDLLLTAKNKEKIIDDEGIQEEVDTFTFEGHDTTAVAFGYILMLIANHQKVQDRIFDEICTILGDPHAKPSYQDLQEMKYMERTIKESLRLYPSVHFISRQLGEDLITKDGYHLPEGTTVMLHIYDLHHNPDIYPDPEKFDPDRFLPENSKSRHPFAYLPFSAGPRNCIGQKFAMLEMKAAICCILSNFILKPVDTPDTVIVIPEMVLRAKDGLKVIFLPRSLNLS